MLRVFDRDAPERRDQGIGMLYIDALFISSLCTLGRLAALFFALSLIQYAVSEPLPGISYRRPVPL